MRIELLNCFVQVLTHIVPLKQFHESNLDKGGDIITCPPFLAPDKRFLFQQLLSCVVLCW